MRSAIPRFRSWSLSNLHSNSDTLRNHALLSVPREEYFVSGRDFADHFDSDSSGQSAVSCDDKELSLAFVDIDDKRTRTNGPTPCSSIHTDDYHDDTPHGYIWVSSVQRRTDHILT